MNIYRAWGYGTPPFQTTALPANELGQELLVGRDAELQKLKVQLHHPPKAVTVEGANGVGKTSLVNVAAYSCYVDFLKSGEGPLLIPCAQTFQLCDDNDVEAFIDSVYMAVGQTLIDEAEAIQPSGRNLPRTQSIDRWLNSPHVTSYQAGFWLLSGGRSTETNTSAGFQRSGFRKEIRSWLKDIFATPEDGGVVCVIDNMELLQTSARARTTLEALRDSLLTVPGLRWVLCGAAGIIQSVATSPRLEGVLHAPIDVPGVDDALATRILDSRVRAFAVKKEPYIPLHKADFEDLYNLLNRNIRSTLSRADNYCLWVSERAHPYSEEEKHEVFLHWLTLESSSALDAARTMVGQRAWRLFDEVSRCGGEFSPGDHKDFGFNSTPAMGPHVRDLENAGLLTSIQDDADRRRKTIQITSKGWLIAHARKNGP